MTWPASVTPRQPASDHRKREGIDDLRGPVRPLGLEAGGGIGVEGLVGVETEAVAGAGLGSGTKPLKYPFGSPVKACSACSPPPSIATATCRRFGAQTRNATPPSVLSAPTG